MTTRGVAIAVLTVLSILLIMAGEAVLSSFNERLLRAKGAIEPPDDVIGRMRWVYPLSFVAMGVEAGGDHQEIRLEAPQGGHHLLRIFPFDFIILRPGGERNVHREAQSRSATFVRRRPGAWIERILVRRHEQHRGILIEDPLRAVAVMHVVVDDGHARASGVEGLPPHFGI